jgi:hypothetical protein
MGNADPIEGDDARTPVDRQSGLTDVAPGSRMPLVSREGVHFWQFRGAHPHVDTRPAREFQELWFSLAHRRWSTLVVVPADERSPAADVATALADVGGRLRDAPVTAVIADRLDFDSARMLSDLQLLVKDDPFSANIVPVEGRVVPPRSTSAASGAAPRTSASLKATPMSPAGQVVVSIQPVVVEPLGVAIARAADAVVVCVRMGVTPIKAARRTIELIGRERVVGAFLVH